MFNGELSVYIQRRTLYREESTDTIWSTGDIQYLYECLRYPLTDFLYYNMYWHLSGVGEISAQAVIRLYASTALQKATRRQRNDDISADSKSNALRRPTIRD